MAPGVVDLKVEGMTCASCVARVEKALRKVPGVAIAAIRKAGYEAAVRAPRGEEAPASHRDAWEVGLAVALTLPLVVPMIAALFGAHWMLPAWLQILLATPVQLRVAPTPEL